MKAIFLGQTVTLCKPEDDQALITIGGHDLTFVKVSDLEIEKPLDVFASESRASQEKKETIQRSRRKNES